MKESILSELLRIEHEFDVKILYACEAGSRAWGFPSIDSDFDVRFLYINRPEWYLSIVQERDVIEMPICHNLDINGWDLLKALRLFRKSNPSLIEWINSPIVYKDIFGLRDKLSDILFEYFSKTVCSYHYLHMANGNFKDYLKADTVWTKKYFYVLRPLLAVVWMQQDKGVVPVDFNIMVDQIDIPERLKKEIRLLIEQKKAGAELGKGKKNVVISNYIEKELDILLNSRFEDLTSAASPKILDHLFCNLLETVWEKEGE